jgi:DNA-directed RNA polymerase subunit F
VNLPGGAAPDAARALARLPAALDEGPIRARAAARALSGADPARAAEVIAALAQSDAVPARAALAAVGQALVDPAARVPYAFRAELYAEAAARGLADVTALLVAPPPRRPYREPRDKADARLAHLTLGHKKALARARRDPDLLARLAAEGEPTVVRELLRNPQLTEELVVRLAARRPCRPETLRCLFESRRWRTRPAVALAVARNPYAEPGIAVKLLPLVAAVDLADVARDGTVHALVRAAAGRIAAGRAGRAATAASAAEPGGRGSR